MSDAGDPADPAGPPDQASPADEEYHPDPDAPPTVEGRVAQANVELRKLLAASAIATALMGGLVMIFDLVRGQGFDHTTGYLLGAAVATLNLWLLSGGFFLLMRRQAGGDGKAALRALLAFGGSFIGLVLLCLWVIATRREWSLGFALGLATPALAGVIYGRNLEK